MYILVASRYVHTLNLEWIINVNFVLLFSMARNTNNTNMLAKCCARWRWRRRVQGFSYFWRFENSIVLHMCTAINIFRLYSWNRAEFMRCSVNCVVTSAIVTFFCFTSLLHFEHIFSVVIFILSTTKFIVHKSTSFVSHRKQMDANKSLAPVEHFVFFFFSFRFFFLFSLSSMNGNSHSLRGSDKPLSACFAKNLRNLQSFADSFVLLSSAPVAGADFFFVFFFHSTGFKLYTEHCTIVDYERISCCCIWEEWNKIKIELK